MKKPKNNKHGKSKSLAKKRSRKNDNLMDGRKKVYYQFEETGSLEKTLNVPVLMLFFKQKKVAKLLRDLASSLPKPESNNHREHIEMIKFTLFMLMSGHSSPEDFNAKISEEERNKYGVNVAPSTFYDYLERIKDCKQQFEKAVEKSAKMFMFHEEKEEPEIVVDIDASYKNSKTLWCDWNYKGEHSFRILFTHGAKEKTGAKAILNVLVDPGNTSPAKDIPETLEKMSHKFKIGLFRSDSASYNTKVTNFLDSEGIDWLIAADMDSSVKDTIACIQKYETYEKEKVKTAALLGATGHAMNKSKQGFLLVNKRVEFSVVNGKQVTLDELFGKRHKDLPLAVSSKYAEGRTLSEIRHDYECRGGQESMIANFKQFYEVKAQSSLEKTAVWINLIALAYNLALYFLRKDVKKKTLRLPDTFELPSLLFVLELFQQEGRL